MPLDVVIPSVSRRLVGIQLAEQMLAQIDALANAAPAAIGQHARESFVANLDVGHTAAEGVLVRTG